LLAEKVREEFGLDLNLAESEKLLNGIAEGSRRTADIVKGLRNFSRVDDEEMKMANINEGIESTLILLQNKIKHQKIEVIKSFVSMPEIRCYPGQLNQVFMNMISNAIDAIGELHPFKEGINDERKISITTSYFTMAELVSSRPEVKEKIFDDDARTKKFVAIADS
jgi:signal transduction histidine kinase